MPYGFRKAPSCYCTVCTQLLRSLYRIEHIVLSTKLYRKVQGLFALSFALHASQIYSLSFFS